MMSHLPHLAQRLFNVPLAIHPAKAEVIMAALADRFGVTQLFRGNHAVALSGAFYDDDDRAPERAYDVVGGIAVIPIQGTLVAKLGTLRPFSGMTGYDGIRVNFGLALEDPAVRGIVLDIDSPGGEVTGLFDLVDAVYAARGFKPIRAILNEYAYSAAYAIASAADRIAVPRTGGTGSVGVVTLHADLSQALSKAGIAVTLIRYGARKFEGNEYEPLTPQAAAGIQDITDTIGDLFVDTVARNRGLSSAAVKATEGETYLGAAGVTQGFADVVQAPDAAFQDLLLTL
jgi:signal peptide peptidase SppA